MADNGATFGAWVRQRRRRLGLTQAQMAHCANCSLATVRKIEGDERRPSRQIAEWLAACLQIPAGERAAFLKVARGELRLEQLHVALPAPGARPASHLPAPLTALVGRAQELAAIQSYLRDPDCRVATIAGPGGVGKTRLALEAATLCQGEFADGAHFAPLAPVAAVDHLVPALAEVLRFAFHGTIELATQLCDYLADKQLLLVLDNFEHLLDGAGLLTLIGENAPGVKFLVTSRERLSLTGEWTFLLDGLALPGEGAGDHLEEYGAPALFLQCARRARAGFEPASEDWHWIADICRAVAGLPMAIELAAAWVVALSCREIAQEIGSSLDFLSATGRRVPERHRSLRAVCDHSWQLLQAEEQAGWRRLSVFPGTFANEVAAQVAGMPLAVLRSLVEKSMVRPAQPGRCDLHPLLRHYAAERLAEVPGEQAAAREAHCRVFGEFVHAREAVLHGPGLKHALAEIGEEIEDVRLGWAWASESRQDTLLGAYVDGLLQWHDARCWFREGQATFQMAAERRRGERSVLAARLLAAWAWFATCLDQCDLGARLFEEARSILLESNATDERMRCELLVLTTARIWPAWATQERLAELLAYFGAQDMCCEQGDVLMVRGGFGLLRNRPDETLDFVHQALAVYRAAGDARGMSAALDMLAMVAQQQGDYAQARAWYGDSLAIRKDLGFPWGVAFALDRLGYVCRLLGDHACAETYHRQSLALHENIGDQPGISGSLDNLGLVAVDRGQYAQARDLFEQALAIRRGCEGLLNLSVPLEDLGNACTLLGDLARARTLLDECLELRRQVGAVWATARALCSLGDWSLAAGDTRAACASFREALQLEWEADRQAPLLLRALAGLAACLAREAQPEPALEYLAFVLARRRLPAHEAQLVAELYAQLSYGRTASSISALEERAAARGLEETVICALGGRL